MKMNDLNINNFRDISGYANEDGKLMKKNRIFRGASLHNISNQDAEYLYKNLGIKYILDYRDEKEALSKKDIYTNDMIYERISALIIKNDKFQGFDFGELLSKEMDENNLHFMMDYLMEGYENMPFNNPAYHKLFELLIKNEGNVYFHCSAGKDRTGLGAFLVMIALGVSEKDCINEYLLSNNYLKTFVETFYKENKISMELKEYAYELLYVNEKYIKISIAKIKEKYHDYYEFLKKEYGIDEEKRSILKSIYCE